MASELLTQKHSWLFKFFDHSNNGSMDINDFKARADRATQCIKDFYLQQEGGEAFIQQNLDTIKQSQHEAHEEFFNHLCKEVDKGSDGNISLEEWLKFCSLMKQHVADSGSLPDWFVSILSKYFDKVLDFDGNGYIDLYELAFMGDAPLDVAWYCFNYLTMGGEQPLTKENFVKFTTAYMSSENPEDVSRYMFGFIPQQ